MDEFNANMEQQRSRSRAAAQSGAAAGLKFEAAATSHLQKSGEPRAQLYQAFCAPYFGMRAF